MKLIIILSLYLISSNVNANKICQKIPQHNPYEFDSRLAFKNGAGPLNIGVCWWHNRFQRSVFYLTTFKPELEKPNKKQLRSILRKLRYMKAVVQIPGFKNIYEFSSYYENEIESVLGKWQLTDSFLYFQWVRGIFGTSKVNSENYKKRMRKIYQEVKNSEYIIWSMLQLAGLDTHSYLILEMEALGEDKYNFKVIDSNYPTITKIIPSEKNFALYLGYNSDIVRIKRIHDRMCND